MQKTVLPLFKWRQPLWLRHFLAFSSPTLQFGPLCISVRLFDQALVVAVPTATLFWTSVTLQPCTWMEEKTKNFLCKTNHARKKGSLGVKEKEENKISA